MATIPAYSKVLWTLAPGYSLSPSPVPGPGPAPGLVWVVREISASTQVGYEFSRVGAALLQANSAPIWATPPRESMAYTVYSAFDVRFVLNNGDILELQTANDNWWIRVSGYELTA